MIGEGLSFERPELLLLLLLVPFVGGLQVAALLRRRRALVVFGGHGAGLSSVRDAALWMKVVLVAVAAASLVVALAGPRLGFVERAVRPRGVDLVILLDVSQSMAVRDIAPDRLRAARDVLQLYGVVPTERIVGRTLQSLGIPAVPQHTVSCGGTRYRLDFAIFCRRGGMAIECDNRKAHRGRRQRAKDRTKDADLRRCGWTVLRLREDDIVARLDRCIARIRRTVRRLDGLRR